MADLIKIKGGSGGVPTLQDREIAYSKTEKALYIGTPDGNIRLCGAEDATKIAALTEELTTFGERLTAIEKSIEDITARLDALAPSE